MPRDIKAHYALGRTCNHADTLAIEAEVEALEETFGTLLVAKDASLSQRLDFVATEILASARRSVRPSTIGIKGQSHGAFDGTLSPYQWWTRSKKELPFQPQMLDGLALARDENWRTHRRSERRRGAERPGMRPYDKQGDNLALRSPIYDVVIRVREGEA